MIQPSRFFLDHLPTPLGTFAIVADAEGRLCAAGFTEGHPRMQQKLSGYTAAASTPTLERAQNPGGLSQAIARYFAGDLAAIHGLPCADFGTEFQKTVWRALREIACGETCSYAELARRIGRPSAVRAVGLANGANPICLIVPCHRVIGADGSLTGYAGGVERKRWLLAHEQHPGSPAQLQLDLPALPAPG
jgi:methylated-DNA-[protein]-cysteine S-methyltransferase